MFQHGSLSKLMVSPVYYMKVAVSRCVPARRKTPHSSFYSTSYHVFKNRDNTTVSAAIVCSLCHQCRHKTRVVSAAKVSETSRANGFCSSFFFFFFVKSEPAWLSSYGGTEIRPPPPPRFPPPPQKRERERERERGKKKKSTAFM